MKDQVLQLYDSLMTNPKTLTPKLIMHATMCLFILFTIFVMLFDHVRHPLIAIIVIALYLIFAGYDYWRCNRVIKKKVYETPVHRLDEIYAENRLPRNMEGEGNEKKRSILVREYEQLSESRAGSFNKQSSVMGRSLAMERSMRRSHKKIQGPGAESGNFITDLLQKDSNHSNSSMFASRLNNSYFKAVESRTEASEQTKKVQREVYLKVMKGYKKSIEMCEGLSREKMSECCEKLRKIMISKMNEVYVKNFENIEKIVQILEENCEIRIRYKEHFPEMLKHHHPMAEKMSKTSKTAILSLQEVLSQLNQWNFSTSGDNSLPFPHKTDPTKLSSYKNVSLLEAGLIKTEKSRYEVDPEIKTQLEKLVRIRKDEDVLLFWDHGRIDNAVTLRNLKLIKEFCEFEGGEEENYIKDDVFNMTERESRRRVAAFEFMRTWINIFVNDAPQMALIHENTSIFRIFNKKFDMNSWQVCKNSEASNYGHPHYDLKFKKQGQSPELFTCEIGSNNSLSLLCFYLLGIRTKSPQYLRFNIKMNDLITKVFGSGII